MMDLIDQAAFIISWNPNIVCFDSSLSCSSIFLFYFCGWPQKKGKGNESNCEEDNYNPVGKTYNIWQFGF